MFNKKEPNLGILISIIHRYGSMYINRKLEKFQISSGQHAYLLFINDHKGCNQEDLVQHFKIDKANVARAVKKLEEKDYIIKSKSNKDNRSNTLNVTDNGHKIVKEIQGSIKEWNNLLMKDLSDNEMTILFKALGKMAKNAEKSIQN